MRSGRDDDLSPPFNAEVKNEWSFTSTPLIFLYGLKRENFTVLLLVTWSNPVRNEGYKNAMCSMLCDVGYLAVGGYQRAV